MNDPTTTKGRDQLRVLYEQDEIVLDLIDRFETKSAVAANMAKAFIALQELAGISMGVPPMKAIAQLGRRIRSMTEREREEAASDAEDEIQQARLDSLTPEQIREELEAAGYDKEKIDQGARSTRIMVDALLSRNRERQRASELDEQIADLECQVADLEQEIDDLNNA